MHSLLQSEIHAQPTTLTHLIERETAHIRTIAATLRARRFSYALIAARGTSDNAARYAQYLFGTLLGLPVALAAPSLHTRYGAPMRFDDALVIGISQSGQSPDICAVVAAARAAGAPTLAITNVDGSPLEAAAAQRIALHAGPERSIAATKTYTAQLVALALLGFALADDQAGIVALTQIPAAVDATLALDAMLVEIAQAERGMQAAVTIGRGYNFATAHETALKLKELTYVPVEPYSAADFQHGPIAMVREAFPIIITAPHGVLADDLAELAQRLRGLGARLIAISDVPAILAAAQHAVPLPQRVDERLSPITAVVPGQLLAFHLARARGGDPDAPRTIRKVTETT